MITTVPTPRINTNDEQVEVLEWHVPSGALVAVGQEIVDVETSKSTVTLAAETAGYIRPMVEKGTVVQVGAPLYLCATEADELDAAVVAPSVAAISPTLPAPVAPPAPSRQPPLRAPTTSASLPVHGPTRLTQAAARLLDERGLSAADFPQAGLLTSRALLALLKGGDEPQAAAPPGSRAALLSSAAGASAAGAGAARSERVSLSKRAEIEMLAVGESGNLNSMLTVYFDSAPIRRRLVNERCFDGNIQPLVLFETARLLRQYPRLTAYYQDGEIHFYDAIDLGVAFDLGKGLKVVTFPQADTLTPQQCFEKTIDVGLRYLDNTIEPAELTGSTFTITDLSGFDILHFHPLINGRQAAIMGIGGDGSQPGHPMSINLVFDHRVTNGREVATFLGELRARLLSYGPPPAEPEAIGSPLPVAVCCDRCAIDLATYCRDFGGDALMMPYYREDGSQGSICHRCAGGWV